MERRTKGLERRIIGDVVCYQGVTVGLLAGVCIMSMSCYHALYPTRSAKYMRILRATEPLV